MQSALSRLPYTHFLSLPLPTFVPFFSSLQSSILSSITSSGLEPSIFVRPTSLHLTLAMLHLPTPPLIQHAASVLSSLRPALTPLLSSPLEVHLRGLASFQQGGAAHVVYVDLEEGEGLERIREVGRALVEGMVEGGVLSEGECRKQGLVNEGKLTVKLHVTCINTKHRKSGAGDRGERGRGGRRQAVDAREILERFGDVDWGVGLVSTCELSRLGWDNRTNFYPRDGSVSLLPP